MKCLKTPILFFISVTLAAFLAACSGSPPPKGEGKVKALVGSDGVQRATITAGSYYFDPSRIVAKVNMPLELTLKKEKGMTPHSFVLKDAAAGFDVELSLTEAPKMVKLNPTKVGEFKFWCGERLLFFESHQEKGMVGFLEVTE